MKAVSQSQFDALKRDVRFVLKEYRTARRAHFGSPDRNPIRVEMRVRGLLNFRALLADRRRVLAGIYPVKYSTYSVAAARSEALRHAAR